MIIVNYRIYDIVQLFRHGLFFKRLLRGLREKDIYKLTLLSTLKQYETIVEMLTLVLIPK